MYHNGNSCFEGTINTQGLEYQRLMTDKQVLVKYWPKCMNWELKKDEQTVSRVRLELFLLVM